MPHLASSSAAAVPSRSLLRFLRIQAQTLDSPAASHSHGVNDALKIGPRRPAAVICSRRAYTSSCLSSRSRPASLSRPFTAAFSSTTSRLSRSRYGPPADPDHSQQQQQHEDDFHVFSGGRTHASKASALDPRLRCTEVDENGEVVVVDGEFKKSELIAKYGLLPRDLRKIDSSNLPLILVRPSAILINLLHLKVLIKHDRLLLFDVYGTKTSYPQSAFMYDLQGKLQQKQSPQSGNNGNHVGYGLPYEFRALEVVLMSVTTELEADYGNVQKPVEKILGELEDDIDRDNLRRLLQLSKKVGAVEQKARLVRDAIEELLEADDDLAAMYLTEKARGGGSRGVDDHTEVEMLLESYHKICVEVVQKAGTLSSNIKNTEEIIRAILDANRNALMLLDLKFSVGTLGLATGTFLAGLFGMNLENFIEKADWGFGTVTAGATVFSLLVLWYGLVKLRKVQRVKMGSSEENINARDQVHQILLDPHSAERLRKLRMDTAARHRRWF